MHAPIVRFVFVKCVLRNPITPTQVSRFLASLLLVQHLNNLLIRESLLHFVGPLFGRTLHHFGGVLEAQVSQKVSVPSSRSW